MLLKHLRISNYRALKEVEMPLSAFVCLTGENNAGKSSVLQALSLFLSGSTLAPSNYFDPAQSIMIAVTLAEIGEPDLALLAPEHRARIEPLIANQSITLVRQYGTDGKSQLGYFGMVPVEPRFGDPAREELMKGKKGAELRAAVIAQFPELTERANEITTQKGAGELISQLAAGLPAEAKTLKFVALPTGKDFSITPMLPERIYIPAVKDLADETKTSESSSFGKILGILLKVIEPKLAEDQALFDRLSKKLTRVLQPDGTLSDERLDEIKAIEASIQGYVQESFSAVKLRIEIPPPELRTVLSTAKILANDGIESPLEFKGDGLRRAVVFSILRAYVKLALGPAGAAENRRYLLMFEEPELFLHPEAQKILFSALHVFSTPAKLPELSAAVDAFFAWERKSIRYEQLRQPTTPAVALAKAQLLAGLRQRGVFLWHKGAIDDYYPAGVTGPDKPSRAQSFRNTVTERPALIGCCPAITCPVTNQTKPEFEFLAEFVAG